MEAGVGCKTRQLRGSEPDWAFLEVAPYFVEYMKLCDTKSLRAACREGRTIADARVSALALEYVRQDVQLPETHGPGAPRGAAEGIRTVREFTTFARGILSRGARPAALTLHPIIVGGGGLGGDGERRDGPENENVALEALLAVSEHHLQQPPASSAWRGLPHLSLCNTPYTDALASAVHSAAPMLPSLDIASDLSSQDALAAATPGLCRLITTTGPSLTSLTFSSDLYSFPGPLAKAIEACTRLQHLQLSLEENLLFDEDGEPSEAEYQQELQSMQHLSLAFSALPDLRSLELVRHNFVVPVGFGLSSMTRLTCLDFNGLDLAPMQDVTALVLSPLRHLVRLTLHGDGVVGEADCRLLAAQCSQLTCLTFDGLLHLDLKGGGLGGRRRGCVPLPAALRELHLNIILQPCVLLALALPPGLTWLDAGSLHASCSAAEGYHGGAGAMGPAAGIHGHGKAATAAAAGAGGADGGAAALPSAGAGVGALKPSACPGFDDLLAVVQLLHERSGGDYDDLALYHDWEPSPLTWPAAGDGHVRLFAALRPLRLWSLWLQSCVLEVGDVVALVEQLPELQGLTLQCQLHPAALPLLARLPHLPHLHRLTLRLPCDRGTEDWLSASTVGAALLPLLLGAPSLETVHIILMRRTGARGENCHPLLAAVQDGVLWLRAQLRRLGRDPLMVSMQS